MSHFLNVKDLCVSRIVLINKMMLLPVLKKTLGCQKLSIESIDPDDQEEASQVEALSGASILKSNFDAHS